MLPLARKWAHEKFSIDDSLLRELISIGSTTHSSADGVAVPCSIQNQSGQRHEKALVLFTRSPPLQESKRKKIHWSNEIAAIAPSPFALSLPVREASAKAEWVSMCYAPLSVKDKQGTAYTLDGPTTFFDFKGVKGEDLLLADDPESWRKDEPIEMVYGCVFWLVSLIYVRLKALLTGRKPARQVSGCPAEAHYFIDWFAGCEELFAPEPALDAKPS